MNLGSVLTPLEAGRNQYWRLLVSSHKPSALKGKLQVSRDFVLLLTSENPTSTDKVSR
jgi:hypothetical protein